ncbi:MAG TPA: sugar porter family MFS transporter [Terriglobia bacterium]|nr:sugar porter family MFS transporter [Terriglobia bacterium]
MNTVPGSIQESDDFRRNYVYVISAIAAMGGFLFGYDLDVIIGALIFLRKGFQLNPVQVGFAVSCASIGCIIGPLVGGPAADWLGRKKTLVVTALIFSVGTLGTVFPRTIAEFDFFRIVGGLGIGLASVTSPMYIAEMAPARLRGRLVTVNQLAIVVGALSSIIVSYFLSASGNWRAMFAYELVPVMVFFVGLSFVPESPRWLFEKKRIEEARQVLGKIYRSASGIEQELQIMHQTDHEEAGTFSELLLPGIRKALLIASALAIFQQFTGASPLTFYLPIIFQQAGFKSASDAIFQTVVLNVWDVFCTILAMWLVERLGRRPLLLIGISGMAASLTLVGFFFARHATGEFVVLVMMVCIGFYIISLAPLTWLIMSEIFPTRLRGKAMGVASIFLWAATFVGTQVVPSLSAYLNKRFNSIAGVFWIFAVVCVVALVFSWYMVPETKGRSLEEIGQSWTT